MKSFRRTTQRYFILALFFRLCSGLSFEQHLVVAKHQATKYIAAINNVINVNAIITEINREVASI